MRSLSFLLLLLIQFTGCRIKSQSKLPVPAGDSTGLSRIVKDPVRKPGASNTDTLKINAPAAVFFQPDSIQLENIRKVTESNVFESTMHEYEYQIRNGHIYLDKNRPSLKIIDTKNNRFLLFRKKTGSTILADLNKYDPSGLFLFDGNKDPQLVDMMNIDTDIPVYFSGN